MNDSPLSVSPSQLPTTTPDLLVAGGGGIPFRVVRISPNLQRLSEGGGEGSPLVELWPDAVPDLSTLVAEVANNGQALADIPLRLRPHLPPVLATIEPAGLSSDYRRQLVRCHFRAAPTPLTVLAPPGTGLVGAGPALREVHRKLALYAPVDAAIVITGETGTGKELVAQSLHELSPRRRQAFVAINCAAISPELLESELFGHEKGAFTGAVRSHRGRFERADRGTLFFDEIGEMPLHTQAKLLRVLEVGRVERVGGERDYPVDVRVVAATNVPLEQAVGEGRFRSDLYHRLSVLRLHLPPLRERLEDIPLLVDHFLAGFNRKYGRNVHRLTPDALELLQSYLWPGNVRELRNVLERVFVENCAEVIGARAFAEWIRERRHFSPGGWEPLRPPAISAPYRETTPPVEQMGRRHSTRPLDLDGNEIRRALAAAEGNLAGAARLLGVHRASLYRALRRLGLSRNELFTAGAGEES